MKARALILAVLALLTFWTCDKPTPVAPAESGLSISANPTQIELRGVATITVIARKSDGNPVNAGTEINFSTTLGSIQTLATTNDRGVAEVELAAGDEVGMATVTASSGAAAAVTVEVQVGSVPALLTLQANPPRIPKEGGTITLVSTVLDGNNNRLNGIPVNFGTEAGTLTSGGGAIDTDSRGEARDTLTLTEFDLQGNTAGFFTVTVSTAGEAGLLLEEFEDITIGGFPFTITLTINPSSIPETGGVISLSALVRTEGGRGAAGALVNFLTDTGVLASGGAQRETDASGQATDELTVSEGDIAGTSTITVSAVTAGAEGDLQDDATITVVPEDDLPTTLAADFGFVVSTTTTAVTFSNQSTGGEGAITLSWDFDNDGVPDATGPASGTGSVAIVSFTYPSPGTYQARLTASDSVGAQDTVVKTVVVPEPPPPDPDEIMASFPLPCIETAATFEVRFDGSASTGEGDLAYDWDVEETDGSPSATSVSTAVEFILDFALPPFSATGGEEYEVNLTVVDELGRSDSTFRVFNIDALSDCP